MFTRIYLEAFLYDIDFCSYVMILWQPVSERHVFPEFDHLRNPILELFLRWQSSNNDCTKIKKIIISIPSDYHHRDKITDRKNFPASAQQIIWQVCCSLNDLVIEDFDSFNWWVRNSLFKDPLLSLQSPSSGRVIKIKVNKNSRECLERYPLALALARKI